MSTVSSLSTQPTRGSSGRAHPAHAPSPHFSIKTKTEEKKNPKFKKKYTVHQCFTPRYQEIAYKGISIKIIIMKKKKIRWRGSPADFQVRPCSRPPFPNSWIRAGRRRFRTPILGQRLHQWGTWHQLLRDISLEHSLSAVQLMSQC